MHANSAFGFCTPKQEKIMPVRPSERTAFLLRGTKLDQTGQSHPAKPARTCLEALLALYVFSLACLLLRSGFDPPMAPEAALAVFTNV